MVPPARVPVEATQTRASKSKDSRFLDRQTFARGMQNISSTDYPAKIKNVLSKRGFVVYLRAPWEDGLNCVQVFTEQLQ